MHRRPPNGKQNKSIRFCSACGLAHNDMRLTQCRNPSCGADLAPVVPPPPGGRGNGNTNNAGNNKNQQQQQQGSRNTRNLQSSQVPVGGGLNKGELDSLLSIERQQKRQQELDDQGCWPAPAGKDGAVFSDEDTMAIAKLKANIACLKGLPEDLQDQGSIASLEKKLAHIVGKAPTPVGEQRNAAKVTHLLGKVRSRYALDKEACQKEAKAAQAALEAAQARVAKAAESEASCDIDFSRRQARIQAILDQCSDALPMPTTTMGAPTVHLPDAPIKHTLPVGVLSSKLAAEKDRMQAEYSLDGEAVETKAIEAFCARLLDAELSTQQPTAANYAVNNASPMDLLGDEATTNHTAMNDNLADAWVTPVPCSGEESKEAEAW